MKRFIRTISKFFITLCKSLAPKSDEMKKKQETIRWAGKTWRKQPKVGKRKT